MTPHHHRILICLCITTLNSVAADESSIRLLDGGGGGGNETQTVNVTGTRPIQEFHQGGLVSIVGPGRHPVTGGIDRVDRPTKTVKDPAPPADNNKKEDTPASDANTDTNCSDTTGNPVIIATGEKIKDELDFTPSNAYGLELIRTYRSLGSKGTMFGPKWLSSYDYPKLTTTGCYKNADYGSLCLPTSITYTRPDGATYTYTLQYPNPALNYRVAGSSKMGTLRYAPYSDIRLNIDKATYTFSSAGYLQKIVKRGQTLLKLTYGADPARPIQATNAVGQTIDFTWAGGRVTKVRDPAGQDWAYSYNSSGMLASVIPPNGAPRTYHYENANAQLLTGVSYGNVRYSTYGYHADGRVQHSTLSGGHESQSFTYGVNSTTVLDQNGQPTTYTFVPVQGSLKLSTVSRASTASCAAASASTIYDANGWIDKTVDWRGVTTDYTFDAAGRLLAKTIAQGTPSAVTEVNVWGTEDIAETTFKDAAGNSFLRVNYTYHASSSGLAANRLSSVVWTDLRQGGTRSTTYVYSFHPSNSLASVSESRVIPGGTATTTSNYDQLGNLVSRINALGHKETFQNHNGRGQPGRSIDPNGVVTDYAYDLVGNLTSSITYVAGGSRTTTYAYDGARRITDITYATGKVDRFRYTAGGRLESTGNALNEYLTATLDITNNKETLSSAKKNFAGASDGIFSQVIEKDSLGRNRRYLGNNMQVYTKTYDANGNLTGSLDAAGKNSVFSYDARNRLTSSQDASGNITTWGYDAEGNLAYLQDTVGVRTNYSYNGFGQVISENSPDSGLKTISYDVAGRIILEQISALRTVSYTWDALNRMTSRTSNGQTEYFTYDEGTSNIGRLTRINDASNQTTFSYAPTGELAQQVATILGNIYITNWTYNTAGQLTDIFYPNSLHLAHAYDAYGRISSMSANPGGNWISLSDTHLFQGGSSTPFSWNVPGGLTSKLNYDNDSRLLEAFATNSSGSKVISAFYNYAKDDTIFMSADSGLGLIPIGYNAAERIVSIRPSSLNETFSLDANGNRLSHTRAGVINSYAISAGTNRVSSIASSALARSYAYDAGGNLASENRGGTVRNYGYDSFGRLQTFYQNGAWVGDYRSNALDRRVYKGTPGSASRFTYSLRGELMYEDGPSPTAYVWREGSLLGIVRSGVYYAAHNTLTGQTHALTNASGQVVWRARNELFGRSVAVDTVGGFNLGFPGQYYDSESSLWYNRYRYYDSSMGRYLQPDPLGLAAGSNRYLYADGNPLANVDPLGLWSVEVGGYLGGGGSLTAGRDPASGSGFMSLKLGKGLGFGASYDPLGGRAGGDAAQCGKGGVGVGVFAEAGGSFGPVSAKVEANGGRNFMSWFSSSANYSGIAPKASFGTGWGIHVGASAGIEITVFGP